jgi:hypothetical protein
MKPHRVVVQAAPEPETGWRVDGIHESGVPDGTLTLSRIQAKGQTAAHEASLAPESLPPFVRVHRRLLLGLAWELETTVTRLTPKGNPIVLSIPLIEGESVTSEGLRVRAGVAQVSMSPQQDEASWRSVLKVQPKVVLTAPKQVDWSEAWQLVQGPIWHVEHRGFAPIHADGTEAQTPTWRPWPGESLELQITRPNGVGGKTSTIDRARLTLSPGQRATDATLELSVRSSRGLQHVVTLPPQARLQQARSGSTELPLRQEGQKVTVPISPGSQHLVLQWRQSGVLSNRFVVPRVELGGSAVNVSIAVKVPQSRWVLLTGGAHAGPAVLFWSLLGVLIVIALGVSRIGLSPLRTRQWVLLLLGLSQVPVWSALIVVGWLLALGWREQTPSWGSRGRFNLRQIVLGLWTVPAAVVLLMSIERGLLGRPDMQIKGNGSSGHDLAWFADRVADLLPQPWLISLPLWVYRVAMLAWSLWLAWALIGWIGWAWRAYLSGALWRRREPPEVPPTVVPAAVTTAPDQASS